MTIIKSRNCVVIAGLVFNGYLALQGLVDDPVPGQVVFPQQKWIKISPEQAGLETDKLREVLASADAHPGGWGGTEPNGREWGAVLTRGGYLVHAWGDPTYKCQSVSLGKCMTRALFGITVEAGVIDPDEPIWRTWRGRSQFTHPHKELDQGHHRQLTWRHLLEHQGGFVVESGGHWRTKTGLHARISDWATWTGDPVFARYGYACVVVNSRGRNGSDGEWDPYVNEPADGYAAQQWIGQQPWCNGKIGM